MVVGCKTRLARPATLLLILFLLTRCVCPASADDREPVVPAVPDDTATVEPWSPSGVQANPPENATRIVWGILGLRGFPVGEHVASNGVEFKQLFSIDFNFNLLLWRQEGLYVFSDSSFWGQKSAPGITNPSQGAFDFSKREFDLSAGVAWNYYGSWEARLFAYSFNNLNRGISQVSPSGFTDGIGLENRYYIGQQFADRFFIGQTYANLGTAAFDPARASFVSMGYYPTKSMVDTAGKLFHPGWFARAYLTLDLWEDRWYLFGDVQFIAEQSFQTRLLNLDAGMAVRPIKAVPRLEFRLGTLDMFNLQGSDMETSFYVSIRYTF